LVVQCLDVDQWVEVCRKFGISEDLQFVHCELDVMTDNVYLIYTGVLLSDRVVVSCRESAPKKDEEAEEEGEEKKGEEKGERKQIKSIKELSRILQKEVGLEEKEDFDIVEDIDSYIIVLKKYIGKQKFAKMMSEVEPYGGEYIVHKKKYYIKIPKEELPPSIHRGHRYNMS